MVRGAVRMADTEGRAQSLTAKAEGEHLWGKFVRGGRLAPSRFPLADFVDGDARRCQKLRSGLQLCAPEHRPQFGVQEFLAGRQLQVSVGA